MRVEEGAVTDESYSSDGREVEPADGRTWLRFTGHDGVKPFIRAEIGDALNESVAQDANFR